MSDGKRRDKKGRILLTGEYQDAAGRYSYKSFFRLKRGCAAQGKAFSIGGKKA